LLHFGNGVGESLIEARGSGFCESETLFESVNSVFELISVCAGKPSTGLAKLFEISSKLSDGLSDVTKLHCARTNVVTPSHNNCRCPRENRQDESGRECRTEPVEETICHIIASMLLLPILPLLPLVHFAERHRQTRSSA
jgi:hypothetical protein